MGSSLRSPAEVEGNEAFLPQPQKDLESKRKSMDWPPTIINTQGSSGVIRTGACVGTPGAPSVLIVLRVRPWRPTLLGAVSLPVWSFADLTWSRGPSNDMCTTISRADKQVLPKETAQPTAGVLVILPISQPDSNSGSWGPGALPLRAPKVRAQA